MRILRSDKAMPPDPPVGVAQDPMFTLEDVFAGETRGWGIFEDRWGRVRRHFTMRVVGQRTADGLILDERVSYRDGAREQRTWQFTRLGGGRYEARTEDVIGVARGQIDGRLFAWRYRILMPIGGRKIALDFDDRFLFHDDGVIVNIAIARKFGIRVGRVTLFFQTETAA